MTTKSFIVLAFWVIALVLFGVVGLDIARSDDFNLSNLGLASLTAGFIVNTFMP